MTTTIDDLLNKIKALESELVDEIHNQQETSGYQIQQKKVCFESSVAQLHKQQLQRLIDYVKTAPIKHILSAPIIWSVIFPTILLDIFVFFYHHICFPIYGIPKVKRSDYIVFDRHYLNYLNVIEKINCAYCSYFNGLIAFVQEIAARTEQFWCPIKHARRISTLHSRYQHFLDYGDAIAYRKNKEKIRKQFDDINK
jgi:hypothetical protein